MVKYIKTLLPPIKELAPARALITVPAAAERITIHFSPNETALDLGEIFILQI